MKNITKWVLASLLLGSFSVVNADVVQVWNCTLKDGKTDADLAKVSSDWLAAAKSMKGGEEMKVYHDFPLVASSGAGGFNFVMIAPNPEAWGVFQGGYDASAAAKADEAWNAVADCSGSSLWNSVKVD
jgi:hypothetical protein